VIHDGRDVARRMSRHASMDDEGKMGREGLAGGTTSAAREDTGVDALTIRLAMLSRERSPAASPCPHDGQPDRI
jgi:hypothetical protein